MSRMLLLLTTPLITRAAGGGVGWDTLCKWMGKRYGKRSASLLGKVPEIVFAIHFGVCAQYLAWMVFPIWYVPYIAYFVATTWSYAFMEIGHKNIYHDGTLLQPTWQDTPGSLERYSGMHYLLPKVGITPRSKWYCRIGMGLKWGLIGLPIFPFGLALIVLGPIAYAIAFRTLKIRWDSSPAEYLQGEFSAWVILFTLWYVGA